MLTLRLDPEVKKFFQKYAKRENRSLSNFMVNSILRYIKNRYDDEYEEQDS